MPRRGFPHSDISGSSGCTHLPGAFRSVPRPSSALDAPRHSPYALVASPTCVIGDIVLLALHLAIHLVRCRGRRAADNAAFPDCPHRGYPPAHTDNCCWGSAPTDNRAACLRRKRPDNLPGRNSRHVTVVLRAMQFELPSRSSPGCGFLSQPCRAIVLSPAGPVKPFLERPVVGRDQPGPGPLTTQS